MNSTTNATTATWQRRMAIAAALCLCIVLPLPVYASHSTDALAGLPVLLDLLVIAAVVFSVNFFTSIGNTFWKNTVVRALNMLLTLPLIALTIFVLAVQPALGMVALAFSILQCYLIYKSVHR